ncbi:MAG: hypothetical protein K0R55_2273 [Sporomusa sp.]|jgi:hypothetical protein|nr:hypothetical protein [Sporomusa sp.]
MLLVFVFRVCLLLLFLIAALKFGDWKNWQKYYPTILFIMVINLVASYLTYHHTLWNYDRDILVKTHTTVEFINALVLLPAVAFTFLSKFPVSTKFYQYGYIALWVLIFSSLELIDHYVVGGISYENGWTWPSSFIFDIAMFSILRLHHLKPIWAWIASALMTVIIFILFNFTSGEFK